MIKMLLCRQVQKAGLIAQLGAGRVPLCGLNKLGSGLELAACGSPLLKSLLPRNIVRQP